MACLTKETAEEFKKAIRDGTITPEKMLSMSSKERAAALGKIVGEENAGWVNAALEAKIILKDQNRGMVSWAKKLTGITPEAKRDLISRIQRQPKVFDPKSESTFLQSLAEKRFGHEITFEEAKNVSELAHNELIERGKIKESAPDGSASRLNYGAHAVTLEDYVNHLKVKAGKVPPSWYLKHPVQSVLRSAGVAKSMLSTLDDSFFGRQGAKVFATNKRIWFRNLAKSFGDIGKELAAKKTILNTSEAMFAIKSDIYSRANALNGKYKAMGLDIHLGSEEAFPSHILTRIPILGRLAAAAETAFNGAALRFRADLADWEIAKAARDGIDVLDPVQGKPLGQMINSMTGRGNIGKLDAFGKQINATIFSVKFLKSNFDTLTAHQRMKGVTPYVRKRAAINLLKIAGHVAGIYTIANILKPGSAELDPRSSDFGSVRIGDTKFDITGGMGSLVTLAARLMPTIHEGKLGWYTKNQKGEITPLGTGKYGSRNPLDVLVDFTEGKFAPYAALLRDMARGKDFSGRQTYVEGHRIVPTLRTLYGAHAPIPLQNFEQTMQNPDAAPLLFTTILDELGFGANTKQKKESNTATPPLR